MTAMTSLTNSWEALVGWTTCPNTTEIFISYLDCTTQIEIFLSRLFRCHPKNCPWLDERRSLSEAIVTRNTRLVKQLASFKQAKVLLSLQQAEFTEPQIRKFFVEGIRVQTPSGKPDWCRVGLGEIGTVSLYSRPKTCGRDGRVSGSQGQSFAVVESLHSRSRVFVLYRSALRGSSNSGAMET